MVEAEGGHGSQYIETDEAKTKMNKFVKLIWLPERELITCYSVHSCHFTKS